MTTTGLAVHQIETDVYEDIVRSGALDGQRVELIDGIITEVSPQSAEHAGVVQRLSAYLAVLNARGLLRVQAPIHVTAANSLPEPDLAVTDTPAELSEHPRSAQLVIEVAVSSHGLDRGRKAELYAATGIPQYWVVDVPGRRIEVHSEPTEDHYRALQVYGLGETVPAPLAGLETLSVTQLLS